MARLIHLNGLPGIGKALLAQLYVDENPGVLNLDIDQVRNLIGGWQNPSATTGGVLRSMTLNMAGVHLRSGHDVIVAHYMGQVSAIERLEAVGQASGAVFCEILLMDTKESAVGYVSRYCERLEHPWHRHTQRLVRVQDRRAVVAAMHDRLTDVRRMRPTATVVPSAAGAIQPTYDHVTALLDDVPLSNPSAVVHRQRQTPGHLELCTCGSPTGTPTPGRSSGPRPPRKSSNP